MFPIKLVPNLSNPKEPEFSFIISPELHAVLDQVKNIYVHTPTTNTEELAQALNHALESFIRSSI